MITKCKFYSEETLQNNDYDFINSQVIYKTFGKCSKFVAFNLCHCSGDKSKCDFDKETREQALKEREKEE
jgi:hypothetical protein